jgi:hypothetical protein
MGPTIRLTLVFVFALSFVVLAATAQDTDKFRARFEVNVDDGSNHQAAATFAEMTSGVPSEYELRGYSFSLMIDVSEADEYRLTVAVIPSDSDEAVIGRFNGRLVSTESGALEFEVEQFGIRVWGVIAVSRIY